jgi:hypothetical protein
MSDVTQDLDSYQEDMLCDIDPWTWAYRRGIRLQGSQFKLKGHEWQIFPMQSTTKKRVARKAAQLGFSELEILRSLHGMIKGRYPTGVLYLFPTSDDVSDFSKARFGPLIADNQQEIGQHVQSTDSTNIKRIGTGMLYLRGARLTSNVEGVKKDSAKLRSIPVDKVVMDERDLMANAAVDMAIERMSHSAVQEYVSFSTPTVPDFGIDKEYQESTQHLRFIKCTHCGTETCLEIDFPNCITPDNRRICRKCKQEIYLRNGRWVASYPDREVEGIWLSQLHSPYIRPIDVVNAFNDPPHGNIQEVYNSKLGMPYIAAEDELTMHDMRACCGADPMPTRHHGPCAMGMDVGKLLHVVIGCKVAAKQYKIVKTVELETFTDVHDLAKRYGVKSCVIDALPETRKVRSFQKAEPYEIFLCYYKETLTTGPVFDLNTGLVNVNRTEICDQTHNLITESSRCQLPRWSDEIEKYAKHMTSMYKVLEVDDVTGKRVYRYHHRGPDHFRHATNYFYLAAQRISEIRTQRYQQTMAESDYNMLD